MGLAAVRKNDDGNDPRAGLREAIRAAAEAHDKADRQREAIHRARNILHDADEKVRAAASVLTAAQEKHAHDLARAATTGAEPRTNGALRAARISLGDAEDVAQAARDALEHLQVDGKDLERANPQLDDAVATAAAEVIAPVAARILERFQRAQDEMVILQIIFQTLTEGEGELVLLPNGQFARLEDPRMRPVKALRERFFNLDPKAGQDRAKEAAVAWRRWRESLRRDPDALPPDDGKS
jgi:chromosome segregation ATPase